METFLSFIGAMLIGFLISVILCAKTYEDSVEIKKDANGLHVSHKDKLYRLVEMTEGKQEGAR